MTVVDVSRTERKRPPISGSGVATGSAAATAAAVGVLDRGGNAVDAAISAAFALGVCEPSGSGLGGQVSLLVASPGRPVVALEGQSFAPAAVTRRAVTGAAQRRGLSACTVPSMVAVLGQAHQQWGVLPWATLLEPAITLASEGHPISPLARRQISWVASALARDPVTAKVFLPDGQVPAEGHLLRQPELARTLTRLAVAGPDDFYTGGLALAIAADMRRRGGLMTRADLAAAARQRISAPLTSTLHGTRVATVAGRGGGLPLLLAVAAIEALAVDAGREGIPSMLLDAAAARAAQLLRDDLPAAQWPGDGSIPDDLLDAAIVRTRAELDRWVGASRSLGRTAENCLPARRPDQEEPGDTTHLSITDADGMTIALTSSIQSLFGAKVTAAGLGFLWNNYLRSCPRRPSPYRLGPGARPRSNAAPTVVVDADGVPVLAVGAAGSRRITSSLAHVLSRVLRRHDSIWTAVRSPRIHVTDTEWWVERPLLHRLGPLPDDVRARRRHDYVMGAVQAVARRADGTVDAAADPRREGTATTRASVPRQSEGTP
jgi:gamma-glutamyltranspeptidase/glutathione hydrolase